MRISLVLSHREPSLLKKNLCTQAITAHTEGQLYRFANCRKGVFMCVPWFPTTFRYFKFTCLIKVLQLWRKAPMHANYFPGRAICDWHSAFNMKAAMWFLSPNLVFGVGESVQKTHLVSWSEKAESTLKWETRVLRRALIYQCADGQAVKHLGARIGSACRIAHVAEVILQSYPFEALTSQNVFQSLMLNRRLHSS